MADVFISYARQDGSVAAHIRSVLTAAGVSVWWDREIQPGDAWGQSIRQHLKAAKAVVVLWSQRSIQSKSVLYEASSAFHSERYLGLVVDDVQIPKKLRAFQSQIAHLDQRDKWIPWLLEELRALGVSVRSVHPAPGDVKAEEAPKRNRGYAFVSHVEEDLPSVAEISSFLKGRGYAYWSYHDSDRDYQQPTLLEIEQRLTDSTLMLAVLSPEWKRSEWTLRELVFAREVRKPLFLLRFRDPGPTLAISGDTYLDFERSKDEGFRRLGIELDKKSL
jgi:TIR domain-containing protein